MKRFFKVTLAALLCVFASQAAWSSDFDTMVTQYEKKEEIAKLAEEMKERLRMEIPQDATPIALWEILNSHIPPSRRAAAGYALIRALFPEGDPARFDEIQGLWLPAEIPVPLAAADGILVTACQLSLMNDPAADALAVTLWERFMEADMARYNFGRTQPVLIAAMLEKFRTQGLPIKPLFVKEVRGVLPCASRVREWIRESTASERNMAFLNAFGAFAQGSGDFAWDRDRGRVYKVITGKIWTP